MSREEMSEPMEVDPRPHADDEPMDEDDDGGRPASPTAAAAAAALPKTPAPAQADAVEIIVEDRRVPALDPSEGADAIVNEASERAQETERVLTDLTEGSPDEGLFIAQLVHELRRRLGESPPRPDDLTCLEYLMHELTAFDSDPETIEGDRAELLRIYDEVAAHFQATYTRFQVIQGASSDEPIYTEQDRIAKLEEEKEALKVDCVLYEDAVHSVMAAIEVHLEAIDDRQKSLASKLKQVDDLLQQYDAQEAQGSRFSAAELADLAATMARLDQELRRLEDELAEHEAEKAALEAEIDALLAASSEADRDAAAIARREAERTALAQEAENLNRNQDRRIARAVNARDCRIRELGQLAGVEELLRAIPEPATDALHGGADPEFVVRFHTRADSVFTLAVDRAGAVTVLGDADGNVHQFIDGPATLSAPAAHAAVDAMADLAQLGFGAPPATDTRSSAAPSLLHHLEDRIETTAFLAAQLARLRDERGWIVHVVVDAAGAGRPAATQLQISGFVPDDFDHRKEHDDDGPPTLAVTLDAQARPAKFSLHWIYLAKDVQDKLAETAGRARSVEELVDTVLTVMTIEQRDQQLQS
ncbi:hypothetical protein H9P43_000802 [Blastocladiella emersonii ATCC 22665]|nr:hypothetical protein H9P43_000802 [Blastocladiella emersonii ATCC 22665]